MHVICKIDRTIYSVVTPCITTDAVIITDAQIDHIKDHHPQDYERYAAYHPDVLIQPDYILEANRPHTAFVLKVFRVDGVRFQLILRLVTVEDPEGYSNSIITFLKISEKKWNKYLRNKKTFTVTWRVIYNKDKERDSLRW